jgi:hypothetical protein
MFLAKLLLELGYSQSPFFKESGDDVQVPMPHLLRDAHRASVLGTYFIRTMTGSTETERRDRPAVHVAEASTVEEARAIHRHLWNQGSTPFLIVSLPSQVRVYTPFAFDPNNDRVGQLEQPIDTGLGLSDVVRHLRHFRAEAIDSGEIWRTKGNLLTKETRVDQSLLRILRLLTDQLVQDCGLERMTAHALVGRFVYLHYLRERDILSDHWLQSVDVDPQAVFSANVQMKAFRRLTDAVDDRFNGQIFPINWTGAQAPSATAIGAAGRAFAGETLQQRSLFQPFDFSYIPIELLSRIYEQFLHDEGKGSQEGAFYTSEPVADYLLSEIESVKPLERGMKVLDPCCGSGIFLVLAFRRLVERELERRRTSKLLPTELRQILTSSIFGVERNLEACQVTEFSLILTLLSYVDPPELHRHSNFRFPVLHNRQIFQADFFNDNSEFWLSGKRFEWIVGNPPWGEYNKKTEGNDEKPLADWIKQNPDKPVARFRKSEAFSWRVTERLAEDGVAGLITKATSLTNDQSADYREGFFKGNSVQRITNFSNLAYILFESAEEPAATIIYSKVPQSGVKPDILHFGPLVVNQPVLASSTQNKGRVPWVVTVSESEIQMVSAQEVEKGDATTWKRALWGNPRDARILSRLRKLLPRTLQQLVDQYNWNLSLGLQLRPDEGTPADRNLSIRTVHEQQLIAPEVSTEEYVQWFSSLKVAKPKRVTRKSQRRFLTFDPSWLTDNKWGTYIRARGGTEGLSVVAAPHLFFGNDFAAYSDVDFILRNPKVGLAAPSRMLKAVSVIWASSITPYFLFLELSAGWGITREIVVLNAIRNMPMPELTEEIVNKLGALYAESAQEELHGSTDRDEWQRSLDEGVGKILSIPSQLMVIARELKEFRLPLTKGKAPRELTLPPSKQDLQKYASRLKGELDGFLSRRPRRHEVTVLISGAGILACVELVDGGSRVTRATVRNASDVDSAQVRDLLLAAQQEYGQWVYVRRSVRVFSGRKIYLCKPSRRMEWTETRAFLDAADIISEVAEIRRLGQGQRTNPYE